MRQQTLPLAEAVGHILRHNLPDEQGRKALSKGHIVAEDDLPRLRALGIEQLRVAILESDDVHEDSAAQRLAALVVGPGVEATTAHTGRVNLLARYPGPLVIDVEKLLSINELEGLTVATLRGHTLVRERQALATIKIIPFAVPEAVLVEAEARGRGEPTIQVRPLSVLHVAVILVGSARSQQRIETGVYPAIEARVAALGAEVIERQYVAPDEQAVAETLRVMHNQGAGLIIVAGETSIMDRDDITPVGIRLAGGRIEHYGAPVEPGNLLLLGYLNEKDGDITQAIPVLGAPGCVRSRDTNIVDLLLPRLLAGEHIKRRDIVALGHGGLL